MRISTAERREQLLDATIEVMKREGVESTSLRKVAVEARSSLAAIHVCFASKEQMMQLAVERYLQSVVPTGSDTASTLSLGVRATVLEFMDRFWHTLVDEPLVVLSQMEIGAWAYRNTQHAQLLAYIYERYRKEFSHLVESAMLLSGEAMSMTPDRLSKSLIVIGDGLILAYLADPTDPEHRMIFDHLVDQLLVSVGL